MTKRATRSRQCVGVARPYCTSCDKMIVVKQAMHMRRIALSGVRGVGKYALVDDEDYERVISHTWRVDSKGYAVATISRKSIRLHRFVMKSRRGEQVDHARGDKLDNRKLRLRLCTNSQNKTNSGVYRSSTTGFRGVFWCKRTKCFRTAIQVNGKKINIGRFATVEEAAYVRDQVALQVHGKFAWLNIL